jgi:hypothetical protein
MSVEQFTDELWRESNVSQQCFPPRLGGEQDYTEGCPYADGRVAGVVRAVWAGVQSEQLGREEMRAYNGCDECIFREEPRTS